MPKKEAKTKKARSQNPRQGAALATNAQSSDNLKRLLSFDRKQRFVGRSKKPKCILMGTDEVGRGCLAGPVVAAAVVLPEIDENSELAERLSQLNDSKKLLPAQRESLARVLHEVAWCAIAQASIEEIDQINILQASLLAMSRAVEELTSRIEHMHRTLPVLVLVDGNMKVKHIDHIQTPVIKGDCSSAAIAAASIIAKVYRDRLMVELSQSHPAYRWEQNKGYASAAHKAALRTHGMTVWHRHLFCQKTLNGPDLEDWEEFESGLDDDEL